MTMICLRTALVLTGAIAALLSGCAIDDPLRDGRQDYRRFCVECHGLEGHGDGPLAAELALSPPDLTMLAVGNDGVFPAEAVMTQIYGYPGRFHKGLMPEFGPLLTGDIVDWQAPSGAVIPTPQGLIDLMEYLRSLQAP